MSFLKALAQDDRLSDEHLETLVQFSALFLRGGGSVTMTEWLALDVDEKAALAEAGDRLKEQSVGMLTLGFHDHGYALGLLGEEGQSIAIRTVLNQALDNIQAKREAKQQVAEWQRLSSK